MLNKLTVRQSYIQKMKEAISKHQLFSSHKAEKSVECVEFVDVPVFDIDGKEYYVDLEDSKMMKDVDRYLGSLEVTKDEFIITEHRTYAVSSLGKYLALSISVACEAAEYDSHIRYVITHLGIDDAVLLDSAGSRIVDPEEVKAFI